MSSATPPALHPASAASEFGWQVNVPGADLGEILPGARLLSRATALTPVDYERAKGLFLAGVDRTGLAAEVPWPAKQLHVCILQGPKAVPLRLLASLCTREV